MSDIPIRSLAGARREVNLPPLWELCHGDCGHQLPHTSTPSEITHPQLGSVAISPYLTPTLTLTDLWAHQPRRQLRRDSGQWPEEFASGLWRSDQP